MSAEGGAKRPTYAITVPALGLAAESQLDYARQAEELGYEGIWLAEGAFLDSFTLAGALIEATSIPVATGIVPIYNRTPMILAMSAATASILSGGRFSLGLGSSSEAIISGWNGLPLERPLKRMRETIGAVRRLLDGEKVDFEGETLRLSRAQLEEAPAQRVPIFVGALNKRMLRLAGELADGVIVNMMLPEQLPILTDELYAGAREAGRDPADLEVVVRLPLYPGVDPEQGREEARKRFGPYVAQGGYNKFFRSIGFEAEAEAVATAYEARDREATQAAISDRLADALVTAGTPEECHRKIAEYGEYGADTVALWPHAENDAEAIRMLGEMAPLSAADPARPAPSLQ